MWYAIHIDWCSISTLQSHRWRWRMMHTPWVIYNCLGDYVSVLYDQWRIGAWNNHCRKQKLVMVHWLVVTRQLQDHFCDYAIWLTRQLLNHKSFPETSKANQARCTGGVTHLVTVVFPSKSYLCLVIWTKGESLSPQHDYRITGLSFSHKNI